MQQGNEVKATLGCQSVTGHAVVAEAHTGASWQGLVPDGSLVGNDMLFYAAVPGKPV